MELSKRDKEIIVMCCRQHGCIFGNFLRFSDNLVVDKKTAIEMDLAIALDFYIQMREYLDRYTGTPEETETLEGALEDAETLYANPKNKEKILREIIRIGFVVAKARMDASGDTTPRDEPNTTPDERDNLGYIQ